MSKSSCYCQHWVEKLVFSDKRLPLVVVTKNLYITTAILSIKGVVKADQANNLVRGLLVENLDKVLVFAIITATLSFCFLLTILD